MDIYEIITETSTEPSSISLDKDNDTEESRLEYKMETPFKPNEKKFITSPADIDVHRKVDLQDAEITKEHQEAFKELCDESKDIFSTDSGNIGKTPLLEMQIDTGDSPLITQRTLHSSLETCCLGTKRIRNLGKSRSDSKKCFTLG